MSFVDKLQEVLTEQQMRDLENEGFGDMLKAGVKLIPALAMMFQLFVNSPEASTNFTKNDVKAALIDMQESKTKSELDATAQDVKNMISKFKGEKRNQFIEVFNKAYNEIKNKVNS